MANIFGRLTKIFKRGGGAEAAEHAAKGAAQAGVAAQGAQAARGAAAIESGALMAGTASTHRALGKTYGALSRVNQIAVYGGMAAGLFGFLAKTPGVGGVFKKAESAAKKPGEFMQETTLGTVADHVEKAGETVLGGLQGLSEQRLGQESGLVARLAGAQKKIDGLGGKLFSSDGKLARNVFQPLGDFVGDHAGDFLGDASEKILGSAGKHHGKTNDALTRALDATAGVDGVHSVLESAKAALGTGAGDMDKGAFRKAIEEAGAALGKAAQDGEIDKGAQRGINKTLQGLSGTFGVLDQRTGLASKLKNMPDNISNAPSKLKDANLQSVALKGAAITGTALQLTGTAKGIGEKVTTLKMMYADLTGETKISTRKLLFSKKVPEVVKQARSQILKEFGPRVVLNFANTVATYTFMKNTSGKSMAASFGLMGISSLHSAKVQTYDLLPMYEAMSTSPHLQPEHYAAFLSAAAPQARAAGGIESPLVQALAMNYAQQGVRPAEILKEIEGGQFDERALSLKQQMIAQQQALSSGGDMSLRSGQADASRAVVGQHTARLQGQSGAAQNNSYGR